jgi:hypothetical protein
MAGYLAVTNIPANKGNDYVKMLTRSGGPVKMLEQYRASIEGENPRSSYHLVIDTGSAVGIVTGLGKSYMHYLFGPSILSIRDKVDVVPAVNSAVRLAIIIFLIYLLFFKKKGTPELWYLLAIFFCVTVLWSLGTTNYGQAFRHNAITDWILAITLVVGLNILQQKHRITKA